MMELSGMKLRVVRPTSDMAAAKRFYMDGLGLEELGSFEGHDSFDGIMLGFPCQSYHLESPMSMRVMKSRLPQSKT